MSTSRSSSGDAEGILALPPRHKSTAAAMASLLLAAVLFSPFLYGSFTQRLTFPSNSDQDPYLNEAQITAEQFTFAKVRPLYSSWLATIYTLTGKDMRRTFYVEKTISVLLLSLLVAFLGLLLFDARTAWLLFIWVLNCKYVLLEPNGSHALAASMLVASILCFFLPNRALRLPASLFILLLSIKVRDEMIVPVVVISGYLLGRAVYRWKKGAPSRAPAQAAAKYYWIGGAIVLVAVMALFTARPIKTSAPYISIIIRTEFAGTYVNRTGLRQQLPGKKDWVQEAWDITYEKLPGVKTDFDVIRMYPQEELANILYNTKETPRVAAAMFLAFDRPLVMAGAFILYILSFIIWRKRGFERWRPKTSGLRQKLIAWSIGTVAIVALIIPLYLSSRHYIQLIPIEIIATMFIVRFAMGKLLLLARPSTREHAVL